MSNETKVKIDQDGNFASTKLYDEIGSMLGACPNMSFCFH